MVKTLPAQAGDADFFPESGRSPEEEMATHSSVLALKIPWTEELVSYSPWGCKESDMTEQPSMHSRI